MERLLDGSELAFIEHGNIHRTSPAPLNCHASPPTLRSGSARR
jgi:hypothetical protein